MRRRDDSKRHWVIYPVFSVIAETDQEAVEKIKAIESAIEAITNCGVDLFDEVYERTYVDGRQDDEPWSAP